MPDNNFDIDMQRKLAKKAKRGRKKKKSWTVFKTGARLRQYLSICNLIVFAI